MNGLCSILYLYIRLSGLNIAFMFIQVVCDDITVLRTVVDSSLFLSCEEYPDLYCLPYRFSMPPRKKSKEVY